MRRPELKEKILELATRDGITYSDIAGELQTGSLDVWEALAHNGFSWDNETGEVYRDEPEPDGEPEDDAGEVDEKPPVNRKRREPAEDPNDLLPCPDRAGYDIDRWCRPWARKSQGRKAGPLKPDYYWYTSKDGRRRFVSGYRTRCDGVRRRDTLQFFAIQRNKAERVRRDG